MKKRGMFQNPVVVTLLAMTSSLAMAENQDAVSSLGLFAIGSGLAMGLAAIGGTLGQGKAASAALEGLARNPGSSKAVFTPMIIALALIEFQTIMGFIIGILWWVK
jgi:F-type H+-transporting ATPase subunit c